MTQSPNHPDLRTRWEVRAQVHQDQARGVLFQGLPDRLNQAIHRWHEGIVRGRFAAYLPRQARVADLAAGYGRLSQTLRHARPDLWLTGADLSLTYSSLYAQQVGPALCADLMDLPYPPNTFDGILLVTGLMYVKEENCAAVVAQLIASLKPGGVLLCIDPGAEFTALLRWLRPALRQRTTGGDGFACDRYLDLFQHTDCTLVAQGSNAFFTLGLPGLWLVSRAPQLATKLLDWVIRQDQQCDWFARLALHRWVLVHRGNSPLSG